MPTSDECFQRCRHVACGCFCHRCYSFASFRFPVPHFIDLLLSLSPLPSALVFSPVILKVLSRRDPALLAAGLELGLWNFGGAFLLSSGGNGSPEDNVTMLFAFTVRKIDALLRRNIGTTGAIVIMFVCSMHINMFCLCTMPMKIFTLDAIYHM